MKNRLSKTTYVFCTLLTLSLSSMNAFAANSTNKPKATTRSSVKAKAVDPNAFTLEMALDYALQDGGVTAVQIAKEQAKQAEGAAKSAEGLMRPTVTADVGLGFYQIKGDGSGAYGTHDFGISIPLLSHQIKETIKSAQHSQQAQEKATDAEINQALLLVTVDYYELVKAQKSVEVQQKLYNASEEFYKREANKNTVGASNILDAGTAQTQMAAALIAITQAQAAAKSACVQLIYAISDGKVTRDVCAHVVEPVVPGSFDVDVTAANAKALTYRPEIGQYTFLINASQDQRDGTGGFWNHFVVSAAASNSSSALSGVGGIAPTHVGSTTTAGALASLTWGGTDAGDIEQADARVAQANTTLDGVKKQISIDVGNAQITLEEAYKIKQQAVAYYDAASKVVSDYDNQVVAGSAVYDATAYVQDLKNEAAAEQFKIAADSNVAEAIAQLETAVGVKATTDINQFFAQSGLLKLK